MQRRHILETFGAWLRGGTASGAGGQPWRVEDPRDLWAVAAAHRLRFVREVRQPLLLISEVQRSGGTLLSRLFDGHPQIYAHPHELKIGRPNKYYWPKLDLSSGPDEWWDTVIEKHIIRLSARGYRKDARADFDYTLPFIYSQRLQRKIFIAAASAIARPSQRQILDAYATSFFNSWIDYQGLYRDPGTVKFWSGFVPRVAVFEEECAAFFRDYPDGFLLSVIRDPLSWFASARSFKPEEYTLEKGPELWLESSRAALRNLARYPGRVILIHFGDLVKNTEGVMRAVCRQMGLDFDPALLVPTFNGMPVWENTSFRVGRPGTIAKASLDRGAQLDASESSSVKSRTEECYRDVSSKTVRIV